MRRGKALVLLLLFLIIGRIGTSPTSLTHCLPAHPCHPPVVQFQARSNVSGCRHCFKFAHASPAPRPAVVWRPFGGHKVPTQVSIQYAHSLHAAISSRSDASGPVPPEHMPGADRLKRTKRARCLRIAHFRCPAAHRASKSSLADGADPWWCAGSSSRRKRGVEALNSHGAWVTDRDFPYTFRCVCWVSIVI